MPAGPMNEDDIDPKKVEELVAKLRVNPAIMESGERLRGFMQKHNAKEQELKAKYGSQFDKEAKRFSLNKAEQAVVDAWVELIKPEVLAAQKVPDPLGQDDEPYYGAIGGGLHYTFIPTGLGSIIVVKETITGKELNVTEALDWFFFG